MIWNDRMIREWAQTGGVTPFDDALVNPASLDLRLGNTIRVAKQCWSLYRKFTVNKQTPASELWDEPQEFDKFVLQPGQLVLCHSLEYTRLPVDACAQLLCKSSTGRLGIEHLHAGWGDPAFHGQWVFEVKNMADWEIDLFAGEPYMQLVFMMMAQSPERDYSVTGRYNGQTGPEAHRIKP